MSAEARNGEKQQGDTSRALIVFALVLAVGGILYSKGNGNCGAGGSCGVTPTPPAATETVAPMAAGKSDGVKVLPRMVDLGAGKCVPCKMMAPILDDLKKTYAGRMEVQFIDVWENPDAGTAYGINIIPTQIFYDSTGKELFRHEGFYPKEDILGKWKELGVDLTAVDESKK